MDLVTLWLGLTAAALFLWNLNVWLTKRWKSHHLVYVPTEFNEGILQRCPRMSSYSPPFFLAHGTVHSIWSSALRERVDDFPAYHRVPVRLSCGASVSIDWSVRDIDRRRKTILVLHGITGHSMASYCKHMVKSATKRGFQCVLMNNRGCGGNVLHTAVSFNAARTSDVREVVKLIRTEFLDESTPLFMIGFSMGGTVLIRYLAEGDCKGMVRGAVAISTNFNMDRTAAFMERPYSFGKHVVNRAFCKRLIQWFRVHEHVFRTHSQIDVELVYRCRTLREYDALVNVPTSEFESVAEYYAACSTDDKVGLVPVPLLCLQSADDPVCLAECIPVSAFQTNPHIILNIAPGGGHVGFLENARLNSSSWMEDCTLDFFDAIVADDLDHR
ncbi:Serine aminopeptidase S33 domain-containing protein [Plasmodiophora brassicae]